MVYNYLLNLYQALDKRQQQLDDELSTLESQSEQRDFKRGRLSIINEFRSFIKDSYHCKLPKRIQKFYK